MTVSGKVWGSTTPVLITPFIEIHRLVIKPWSRCSMHKHNRKWNAFITIDGELYIDVEKSYGLTDTTVLHCGEICTVSPGEYHQFRTGAKICEAFEIYYSDVLSEDIERRNQGECAAS